MIWIDFDEPDTQEWQAWRAVCQAEQEALNVAKAAGEEAEAKSRVYGRMKETVYICLNGPFHGKCAFCEEPIYSNQHGDIEHFRPKGAVKDKDNQPVKIENGGHEEDHPGYYWLAYDWQNLLPACVLCNQPSTGRSEGSRIGKWNYFPLADEITRAIVPGEEQNEDPLLINPTQEDPANHIGMDLLTGTFFAVDESPKGGECINTFGLNERDLPYRRATTYDDVKTKVLLFLNHLADDPDSPKTLHLKRRLGEIKAGREPFTMAGRLAILKIEENLGFPLPI